MDLFQENNSKAIESDADEQLLILASFRQSIKLRSIKIQAPLVASAPKSIKLFVNNPSMDFSDAESATPTEAFTLKPSDWKAASGTPATTTLMLKFAKFMDVNTLSLFIASNQGDTASTSLQQLRFFGLTQQKTNMNELKKSG